MSEHDLMQQGMDLLLFGMGTVFVFLSLLVLSTSLMSSFINQFFPEAAKEIQVAVKTSRKTDEIKPHILKAIKLAIAEHRAKQQ